MKKKWIPILICLLVVAAIIVAVVAVSSQNKKTEPAPTEAPAPAEAASAAEEAASEPSGDLLEQIKSRGYITIATEGNWSPWTYHDENDQLVGLDIEIGSLIAEGLGVEARFMETSWDSILAGVDTGRFDLACNGVGYTEERAKKYTFSTPYVYTHKVLVVSADNEEIKTVEDLAGKTSANSASSTYAALAEEYGATVTYVDTLGETMAMLEQGRVDATINAQVSVEDYLREHPDAKIKVVQVLPGDPVVYPVKKDKSTETLIAAINDVLEAARQNGRLAEISVKYFGLDLTKAD